MLIRVLKQLLIATGILVLSACTPKQDPPLAGQKLPSNSIDDLVCEGELCQMPVVLLVHREVPVCMGVVVSDREVLTSSRCLGVSASVPLEDLTEDLTVVVPHPEGTDKEEVSVVSILPFREERSRLVRLRLSRPLDRVASGSSRSVAVADAEMTLIVAQPDTSSQRTVLKLARQTGCKTIATPVFYPFDLKEDALGVVLKGCLLDRLGRGALAIDERGQIAGLIEASFDGNKIYQMIVESYRDLLNWEGTYNRNFALLSNAKCWTEASDCPAIENPTEDFLRPEMAGVFLNDADKEKIRIEMTEVQSVDLGGFRWQLDTRTVSESRVLVRPVPSCYDRDYFKGPFDLPRELKDDPRIYSSKYLEVIPALNENFQIHISRIDFHLENLELVLNWKSSPIDAKMSVQWADFYFQNQYSISRCQGGMPSEWELRNSTQATTSSVQQIERVLPNFETLFTEDNLF